jgi:hypothetical protein
MGLNHRGVEYMVLTTETPGIWQWQFRIGDEVKTGKTETRISLLAMRRVQLRIDRELKNAARDQRRSAGQYPPTGIAFPHGDSKPG